jgi:hypothetical protein
MGFWKVCLRPRVGQIFYVVIQAATAREAVEIALGRYANSTEYGSPTTAQGPERRI